MAHIRHLWDASSNPIILQIKSQSRSVSHFILSVIGPGYSQVIGEAHVGSAEDDVSILIEKSHVDNALNIIGGAFNHIDFKLDSFHYRADPNLQTYLWTYRMWQKGTTLDVCKDENGPVQLNVGFVDWGQQSFTFDNSGFATDTLIFDLRRRR